MKEILFAVQLAALFHDIGKCAKFMQLKLRLTSKLNHPYSHEWVSLKIFEAICVGKTDEEWLTDLASGNITDKDLLSAIKPDGKSEFSKLAPFAQLVAWLIVSHHSLPNAQTKSSKNTIVANSGEWVGCFDADWNSNRSEHDYSQEELKDNWLFDKGTLLRSKVWKLHVERVCKSAVSELDLSDIKGLACSFTMHYSRAVLVLADHTQSAKPKSPNSNNHDNTFKLFANTRKSEKSGKKVLNQFVDEHCIGVCDVATELVTALLSAKKELPNFNLNETPFTAKAPSKYKWQNDAYELVKANKGEGGHFIVNIASTGQGKTIANPRLLHAASNGDFRFTTAIGLRVLTLQTANEYRKIMGLSKKDSGVKIGGESDKDLNSHGVKHDLDEITFDGDVPDFISERIAKLVSPPSLSCTIDHMVGASDTLRGGRQVAPILRLLTSDIILDEPDDFSTRDLPAITRVAYFAGLFGSNIVLSSATLTPSIVRALFSAYKDGRDAYSKFTTLKGFDVKCFWVSEHKHTVKDIANEGDFKQAHKEFTEAHCKAHKERAHVKRRAEYLNVSSVRQDYCHEDLAKLMKDGAVRLHKQNYINSPCKKRVSFGVIRMNQIDDTCRLTELLAGSDFGDIEVKLCCYHSQFPLELRNEKEKALDVILSRKSDDFWTSKDVQAALETQKKDVMFIVVGTPIVEVGRDHDYDWAICEPLSLRSLTQLAGRVLRHRNKVVTHPNVLVLSHNIKGLLVRQQPFGQGFESRSVPVANLSAEQLLGDESSLFNAGVRLTEPKFTKFDFAANGDKCFEANSLIKQEHRALWLALGHDLEWAFKQDVTARDFWKTNTMWSGEIVRKTKFRQSAPRDEFVFNPESNSWAKFNGDSLVECSRKFVENNQGNSGLFFASDVGAGSVSKVSLRSLNNGKVKYQWDRYIGVR